MFTAKETDQIVEVIEREAFEILLRFDNSKELKRVIIKEATQKIEELLKTFSLGGKIKFNIYFNKNEELSLYFYGPDEYPQEVLH